MLSDDIANLQQKHTVTMTKLAQYKRRCLDLSHRLLQVSCMREFKINIYICTYFKHDFYFPMCMTYYPYTWSNEQMLPCASRACVDASLCIRKCTGLACCLIMHGTVLPYRPFRRSMSDEALHHCKCRVNYCNAPIIM